VTTAGDVKEWARELDFQACGIAHLEPNPHARELDDWLARGLAGTMRYLHRQARKRKEPASIVPEARVAVVVLENYLPPGSGRETAPVHIARYARGEDYHRALLRRLELLAERLRQAGARIARPYADAGPVPERELARRAGLGWIGKNTMLIRPGAGSWFFIGSVFTDLPLEPDASRDLDRCGSCTRCLDACPTAALPEPYLLDATRCLSYLTIEWKGEIPPELGNRSEGWAFGCDICNEVCPWNVRFAEPTRRTEYFAREVPDRHDPGYFERMSQTEFAGLFGDTPLERPGLAGMRRNWKMATEGGVQKAECRGQKGTE
jgi:epoxyqueuosine reductase